MYHVTHLVPIYIKCAIKKTAIQYFAVNKNILYKIFSY